MDDDNSVIHHDQPVEVLVEDLHKSFDDQVVLRGVDLTIRRGEIVAIVGMSGCGKTVLLRHVIGSLDPDRGRVLIADHERDGAPLVDLDKLNDDGMEEIRVHWAIVFQRNALFSGTVYENVALWLREVRRLSEDAIVPRVRGALDAVGLDVEAVLHRDRDELSGGMAKRVAIARAIAIEPLLMFYDEPTTGLDPHLASQIQELVLAMHQTNLPDGDRRTTVVVTHDKDLLRRLQPRVVMLHDGRVMFDGSYESFEEADSELIRPYLEAMPILHRRLLR